MGPTARHRSAGATAGRVAVILSLLPCAACAPAARSNGAAEKRADLGSSAAAAPEPAPLSRAWPLAPPGSGLRVGRVGGSSDRLTTVSGAAALVTVADRCPDHAECERIANNSSDVARAACDAQCDRCCPHPSVADCILRECTSACDRCGDDPCRRAICNDRWLNDCRDRCESEMSTCAGCRRAWCADGSAVQGCHADARSRHTATLRACDRDCPAAERQTDGSCFVACGKTKQATCTKAYGDCTNGRSPDCRCECAEAVAGACVTWNQVCTCD
jgi:hypothetical protein